MDPIKVSLVSPKEMRQNSNGENSKVMGEGVMNVAAIPDLNILTRDCLEILTYLEDPKNQQAINTNEGAIKMMLNNKYADTVPYGVITLLMEKEKRYENVDRLMKMFEQLAKAKRGEVELEQIEKDFVENVSYEYIYKPYGSKENFEREMMKDKHKKK
jgi:hypothetical protein